MTCSLPPWQNGHITIASLYIVTCTLMSHRVPSSPPVVKSDYMNTLKQFLRFYLTLTITLLARLPLRAGNVIVNSSSAGLSGATCFSSETSQPSFHSRNLISFLLHLTLANFTPIRVISTMSSHSSIFGTIIKSSVSSLTHT